MAMLSMGDRQIRLYRSSFRETDIVRIVVIIALTVTCTIVTALSFSSSLGSFSYPLYFVPILYATFFYGKNGLVVAGICSILFQAVGYYYRYPDPAALISVTSEAVLLVVIAALIIFYAEQVREGEARYRMVFEHSQLGIVLFDRRDFVIKEANLRFASMLNFSIAELQAMPFPALFFNAPEKGRFFEYIEKNGDIQDFETRLRTKEGHGCWVNLSWSAMDERVISVSAVDITARKLMEKVNQDTLLKYRELTENSPNGILVIQDGLVRSANPSFTSFSGFSVEEVAGKPLLHLVDPRDHDTCSTFFQQFEGNVPVADRTILRFVTKSGLLRTGVLFTNPTLHHGEPATMVNLVDISEQQRLEEKIHQDNERRRGIIITVAHELRTPLQPILGYLNLLVQDPEGFGILADAKKMLERCLVSVERERQIINQMLELSVLESGKLQLSYSSFSPANLVMSVMDASGYPAKAEVTLDIPADLIISADMDRLFSVIDSLMANAVNYSKPPRKIRIFYRPGRDGSTHTISVQDNGVGIAAEMFDSIFEPFQLADAVKLSRKYNRLGLSLSIAKKIIQMHRGSITLESVLNGGSTFTIHLPKEKPPDA